MSVQKINVLLPPAHRLAPGAAWIADSLVALIVAAGARFAAWRVRAERDAAERRIARDRVQLQALAAHYMQTQPSFAKDLLSAAMQQRES
jgi:hypothetical protein